MFEKLFLTPEDLRNIDPTHRLRDKLQAMHGDRYMPPSKYFAAKTPSEWLDILACIQTDMSVQRWPSYVEYNLSLFKKFGPQGGVFPLSRVEECYTASYTNAEYQPVIATVRVGRDYLIRLCRQLRDKYGYPQPVESKWVATHSGVPYSLKKGSFFAETVAFKNKLQHLVADFPGQRRQRRKDRTINQDGASNVRFIEDLLNGIRNWAKKYIPYFSSWCNPTDYVQPQIYRFLQSPFRSLMFDFEHMDEHFSLEIAMEVVYPIWEQLLTPAEQMHMGVFLTEAFSQPIFMGTYLLTGKHNLLSGQSITNDIETWYAICLLIGSVLVAGGDLAYWLILALGDDTLLITNKQRDLCSKVKDIYHEEANLNGVVVHPDKTDDSQDRVIYLRRLYQPGGVVEFNRLGEPYYVGAYPSVLALNNIIQPERLSKTNGLAFCAVCQRLDNVYGSPDYYLLVDKLFRYARGLRLPSEQEVLEFSLTDWWNRLYDEPWSPSTSRTFRHLIDVKHYVPKDVIRNK